MTDEMKSHGLFVGGWGNTVTAARMFSLNWVSGAVKRFGCTTLRGGAGVRRTRLDWRDSTETTTDTNTSLSILISQDLSSMGLPCLLYWSIMDDCAVWFACPCILPPSASSWKTTKTHGRKGHSSVEGRGDGKEKKEMLKGDLEREREKTTAVPKTYPNSCICDAVILIPGPLHFTSVHSQKVSTLQGKHTHVRIF